MAVAPSRVARFQELMQQDKQQESEDRISAFDRLMAASEPATLAIEQSPTEKFQDQVLFDEIEAQPLLQEPSGVVEELRGAEAVPGVSTPTARRGMDFVGEMLVSGTYGAMKGWGAGIPPRVAFRTEVVNKLKEKGVDLPPEQLETLYKEADQEIDRLFVQSQEGQFAYALGHFGGFLASPLTKFMRWAGGKVAGAVVSKVPGLASTALPAVSVRRVVKSAIPLSFIFAAHQNSGFTIPTNLARRGIAAGHGAVMGSVFGVASQINVATHPHLSRVVRIGIGKAMLDLTNGEIPYSDLFDGTKSVLEKTYEYGLPIYFLWKGISPKAEQGALAVQGAVQEIAKETQDVRRILQGLFKNRKVEFNLESASLRDHKPYSRTSEWKAIQAKLNEMEAKHWLSPRLVGQIEQGPRVAKGLLPTQDFRTAEKAHSELAEMTRAFFERIRLDQTVQQDIGKVAPNLQRQWMELQHVRERIGQKQRDVQWHREGWPGEAAFQKAARLGTVASGRELSPLGQQIAKKTGKQPVVTHKKMPPINAPEKQLPVVKVKESKQVDRLFETGKVTEVKAAALTWSPSTARPIGGGYAAAPKNPLLWFKRLAKADPEFKKNPVFTVQEKGEKPHGDIIAGEKPRMVKRLVYQSGQRRYSLVPETFGIDSTQLKPGQKLRLDFSKGEAGFIHVPRLKDLKDATGNLVKNIRVWSAPPDPTTTFFSYIAGGRISEHRLSPEAREVIGTAKRFNAHEGERNLGRYKALQIFEEAKKLCPDKLKTRSWRIGRAGADYTKVTVGKHTVKTPRQSDRVNFWVEIPLLGKVRQEKYSAEMRLATPEQKALLDFTQDYYNKMRKLGTELGTLKGTRDYYITHMWKDSPDKVRSVFGGGAQGTLNRFFQFAKKRTLDHHEAGIAKGLTPELDVAKKLAVYTEGFYNTLAAQRTVEYFSTSLTTKGVPMIVGRPDVKGTENYVASHDLRLVNAFTKWQFRSSGKKGTTMAKKPQVVYLHPEIAKGFEKILNPLESPKRIATLYRGMRGTAKRVIMVNPLIHGGNIISDVLDEVNFNPFRLVKVLREGGRAWRAHDALVEEALKDNVNLAFGERFAQRWLEGTEYARTGDKAIDKFIGWVYTPTVRGHRVFWALDKLLWNKMVLYSQLGVYKLRKDGYTRAGFPAKEAGLMAANYTNILLGTIPNSYMAKVARQGGSYFLFARNWTFSNYDMFFAKMLGRGRGFGSAMFTQQQRAAIANDFTKHIVKGLVALNAFNNIVNYALNGHSTFDPRQGSPAHWFDIKLPTPGLRGETRYTVSPMLRYIRDYLTIYQAARGQSVEAAFNKMEPIMQFAVEELMGERIHMGGRPLKLPRDVVEEMPGAALKETLKRRGWHFAETFGGVVTRFWKRDGIVLTPADRVAAAMGVWIRRGPDPALVALRRVTSVESFYKNETERQASVLIQEGRVPEALQLLVEKNYYKNEKSYGDYLFGSHFPLLQYWDGMPEETRAIALAGLTPKEREMVLERVDDQRMVVEHVREGKPLKGWAKSALDKWRKRREIEDEDTIRNQQGTERMYSPTGAEGRP